jgi:hypothetical protein
MASATSRSDSRRISIFSAAGILHNWFVDFPD